MSLLVIGVRGVDSSGGRDGAARSRRVRRAAGATALAVALASAAAGAATLNVVGGTLTGASGVGVGGSLYDVAFVDGTCASVFAGCDDSGDFTFTTESSALAAAQALLDQVFVDGPAGSFDSYPDTIAGCFDPDVYSGDASCGAYTPYAPATGDALPVSLAFNLNGIDEDDVAPDAAVTFVQDASTDTTDVGAVYVVWSPVPEPGAGILIAAGLLWIAGRGRAS